MATQLTCATTDDELMRLSAQNPELRFERNADGSLVTMAPTGGISSNREIKAGSRLNVWVDGTVTQYPTTATLDGEAVVPGFKLVLKILL